MKMCTKQDKLCFYTCGLVADILIVMPGIYMLLKMYSMLKIMMNDATSFYKSRVNKVSQLHNPCYDQPLCYAEENLSAGISVHLDLPQIILENYRNELPLFSTVYYHGAKEPLTN